jgi:hypothetical protein
MVITGKIVGYVCDTPRLRADAQVKRMADHNIEDVWIEGRKVGFKFALAVQTFDKLVKYVRPGEAVAVDRVFVMAPGLRDRHARLIKRLAELKAKGVHVLELSTGRCTANPGNRDMMLADAMSDLSRVGRHKSPGRPVNKFDPAADAIIARHWKSAAHVRDADALAAMKQDGLMGWSVSMILKARTQDGKSRYGPSGRPYAKKTKAKQKTR